MSVVNGQKITRKESKASQFVIQKNPYQGWNYRLIKYPDSCIDSTYYGNLY